jgi:hypothetical protein
MTSNTNGASQDVHESFSDADLAQVGSPPSFFSFSLSLSLSLSFSPRHFYPWDTLAAHTELSPSLRRLEVSSAASRNEMPSWLGEGSASKLVLLCNRLNTWASRRLCLCLCLCLRLCIGWWCRTSDIEGLAAIASDAKDIYSHVQKASTQHGKLAHALHQMGNWAQIPLSISHPAASSEILFPHISHFPHVPVWMFSSNLALASSV